MRYPYQLCPQHTRSQSGHHFGSPTPYQKDKEDRRHLPLLAEFVCVFVCVREGDKDRERERGRERERER